MLEEYNVGDRVRSLSTGNVGTVIAVAYGHLWVHMNDELPFTLQTKQVEKVYPVKFEVGSTYKSYDDRWVDVVYVWVSGAAVGVINSTEEHIRLDPKDYWKKVR